MDYSKEMHAELTKVVQHYKNIIEFRLMPISHHDFIQGEIDRLEVLLNKAK